MFEMSPILQVNILKSDVKEEQQRGKVKIW